jgi:hypothetical protein
MNRIGRCLLVFACTASVSEQAVLREWSGRARPDFFGQAFADVGDLDGDGAPEIGLSEVGRLHVFSGADGSELLTVSGPDAGGPCCRLGDIDGDGVIDLLVFTGNLSCSGLAGEVRFRSAGTGALLRRHPCFDHAAVLGDLDQDGVPDYAIGDRDASSGNLFRNGRADVISGKTGAILKSYVGTFDRHSLGEVYPAGDFNGDGVPDLSINAKDDEPFLMGTGRFRFDALAQAASHSFKHRL